MKHIVRGILFCMIYVAELLSEFVVLSLKIAEF